MREGVPTLMKDVASSCETSVHVY